MSHWPPPRPPSALRFFDLALLTTLPWQVADGTAKKEDVTEADDDEESEEEEGEQPPAAKKNGKKAAAGKRGPGAGYWARGTGQR